MATVANMEIRSAAKEAGVFFWQIAEHLNIQDSAFSRKLRRELPAAEKEKVLTAIRELSQVNQEDI